MKHLFQKISIFIGINNALNLSPRVMKHLFGDQRGGIMILAAFAIPVLLIASGMAIELNRYMKASGYVQNAVDQAAVAAIAVDGQDRVEVATRFFYSNLREEERRYITLNSITAREDFPPGGPLTVTIDANVSISSHFGGFLGFDTLDVTRHSQALREIENVEAVITLASSGTMCANKSRSENTNKLVDGDTLVHLSPDPSCTDFNAMKSGVKEFLTIVDGNDTIGDFKIGLVPYNYLVKMPDLDNIPPSLTKNESAGFYEDLIDAEPLSPVQPLVLTNENLRTIEQAIDDLKQTPEGMAWSRSDIAALVAGMMLDPNSTQYFPGGHKPTAFDDPITRKVIIMMTDGTNTGCCYSNSPEGDFSNQYVYSYKPYNQAQLDICELLKEQGITIYSILFNVSETDPGGREINNVFARCSSGAYAERGVADNAQLSCSDKQHCYNVEDNDELVKAYRQIAQTFYNPVISE